MTLSDLFSNLNAILPLAVLVAWTCGLLLVDLFIPHERKEWTAILAGMGLILSLGLAISRSGQYQLAFSGMVSVDGFSLFLNVVFLVSGLVGVIIAHDYLKRLDMERGEYYILLLFSVCGMMLMSMAADLIVIFLALEWLSFPLYIMAGIARFRQNSEEAALKYFLLGAFAGGFVVYGTALVFGATGTTGLAGVVNAINGGSANIPLLTVGAGLVLIGLGFKVSAVPFHMWTPDVYQGAPTAVTAFMSVGAKAGGFAALLRIFTAALPALSGDITTVMWGLAALTMFIGNVVAIAQSNIKRMLAYSSIAHAGYILIALVSFGQAKVAGDAVAAALFYLLAYGFTSFGAWSVVMELERDEEKGLELADYAGLGRKYPALAAAMTVFMLSFTGVPPTLGFIGKFYIFRTAIEGGFIGLALIGVLTSLVSAYYYLRVVVIMYMRDGEPEVRGTTILHLTVYTSALAVVILSLLSGPLLNWAAQAMLAKF